MTRTRASAKAAGSSFERLIADHLKAQVSEFIDRRVKTGAADKGDLANVRMVDGREVVAECKDYGGSLKAAEWTREAEVEAANAGAALGIVIAKRRGSRDPGKQWVLMTVDDLVVLLGGVRG